VFNGDGGTTTWERLIRQKESYPVEVTEYSVAQSIDHEPLRVVGALHSEERNRIITAVSKRYHKRSTNMVSEVPETVEGRRR
jgi:hypothetical protein